jgi:isopenicillin N synthase-like dioxygenase
LVGTASMNKAHNGMSTLLDIGSQITSAVLGSDSASMGKLLDDCSRGGKQESESALANTVSNSYQRLIRYLEPPRQQIEGSGENDPAFWPHVDSTFLTLIPMTAKPGLEVWCPSSKNVLNDNLAERGEWVKPIRPIDDAESSRSTAENECNEDDCVYVFALAGEFLQLLSDGNVPTCIHRVIPPQPPLLASCESSEPREKYVPRVSAPLFVRPRRGEDATLDIQADLNTCTDETHEHKGIHFEEGLLEECDGMCAWEYMDCMSPNN